MNSKLVYPVGTTKACKFASQFLETSSIKTIDHPSPEITHLLLDVPSFDSSGNLRSGEPLDRLLAQLPPTVTVIGGNLSHPLLNEYQSIDLLQDGEYLSSNAAITAECALQIALIQMNCTFRETPTLILGWGRIGKCLGQILKSVGTDVIIAARAPADRAMLRALNIPAVPYSEIPKILPAIRLLFNTVPAVTFDQEVLKKHPDCIKIELSSAKALCAENVISATGLPGRYAPESSGRLISKRILAHFMEDSL